MPLELFEDAYGDPRNATTLATICHYTYWQAGPGAEQFKSQFGLDAKLISVDNTQAYVASDDNHLIVSFRGSEDPNTIDGLKDWLLTNALNLLVLPEGRLGTDLSAAGVGARFHSGFVSAIGEIWDPLYAEVDARHKQKDRPLWITGHSLGGALALLAAWLFLRRTISPHQVYTFGAPMIGNAEAAKAFDREFPGKIFRYVNTPDPVPLLPMMSLVSNDYAHCEKVMSLGDTEAAANLFAYLRSSAGEAVTGLLTGDVANKVWGGIKTKLIAHLLPDYMGLIK
jgi:hypothetical protein